MPVPVLFPMPRISSPNPASSSPFFSPPACLHEAFLDLPTSQTRSIISSFSTSKWERKCLLTRILCSAKFQAKVSDRCLQIDKDWMTLPLVDFLWMKRCIPNFAVMDPCCQLEINNGIYTMEVSKCYKIVLVFLFFSMWKWIGDPASMYIGVYVTIHTHVHTNIWHTTNVEQHS